MNMEDADVRAYWGASLRRYPAARVNQLTLPERSKAYLIGVGLPVVAERSFLRPAFRFDLPVEDLPTGPDLTLVVVGMCGDLPYCLRQTDGAVVMLSNTAPHARYVNKDVVSLGVFLTLYEKAMAEARTVKFEERRTRELVKAMRQSMLEFDSSAFSDRKTNRWPMFLK